MKTIKSLEKNRLCVKLVDNCNGYMSLFVGTKLVQMLEYNLEHGLNLLGKLYEKVH